MSLNEVEVNREYIIREVVTEDEEMKSFLFSLGCYSGEPVTVVSHKRKNLVITIKDARYNVDADLASLILVQAAA